MPMYLYLLERTTQRSRWARYTLQSEVKIGITQNPDARLESVRKSTRGDVERIYLAKFRNARRVESLLHRKYVDSRFRMSGKGKKTNGETEWFYMSWLELMSCYYTLWCMRWAWVVWLLAIVGFWVWCNRI